MMRTIGTSSYINSRSVFLKLEVYLVIIVIVWHFVYRWCIWLQNLTKGRYVILPTTFSPNEEAEFMLRLYTTEKANAE